MPGASDTHPLRFEEARRLAGSVEKEADCKEDDTGSDSSNADSKDRDIVGWDRLLRRHNKVAVGYTGRFSKLLLGRHPAALHIQYTHSLTPVSSSSGASPASFDTVLVILTVKQHFNVDSSRRQSYRAVLFIVNIGRIKRCLQAAAVAAARSS